MSCRGRLCVVVALCGLFSAALAPAAAPADTGSTHTAAALERIDSCRRSLVADRDVGYDRIALRCPELARSLDGAGLALWMPAGWKRAGNDLTAQGLTELAALLRQEVSRATTRATPSTQALAGILQEIDAAHVSRGWWARFREWLRHALRPGESGPDTAGWLGQLHLSPAVLAKLVIGAAVLCVLLAAALLLNELKAAGLLRRRAQMNKPEHPLAATFDPRLQARDVDRAPLRDRPALLLQLAARRLPPARLHPGAALTARELQLALEREGPPLTAAGTRILGSLVEIAESIRYAQEPPADSMIESVVEHGRAVVCSAAA